MLRIIKRAKELPFDSIMYVYSQSIQENGSVDYPHLTADQQVINAEQDFYQYLKEIFFATPGAFYALWTPEGRCTAAVRFEHYRDGLLLEGLETAPEARGRGYAKALLQASLDYLREDGQQVIYSHVDKENAPSLAVHQACGFQRILEHAVYIDGSVSQKACTLCRYL